MAYGIYMCDLMSFAGICFFLFLEFMKNKKQF